MGSPLSKRQKNKYAMNREDDSQEQSVRSSNTPSDSTESNKRPRNHEDVNKPQQSGKVTPTDHPTLDVPQTCAETLTARGGAAKEIPSTISLTAGVSSAKDEGAVFGTLCQTAGTTREARHQDDADGIPPAGNEGQSSSPPPSANADVSSKGFSPGHESGRFHQSEAYSNKTKAPEDVLSEENAGHRAGESTELERKAEDADALDKGEDDRLTSDETRNLKNGQIKSTETKAERDEDGTGGIGPMNPQDDKQGEHYRAAPGTLAATDTSVPNESIKKKAPESKGKANLGDNQERKEETGSGRKPKSIERTVDSNHVEQRAGEPKELKRKAGAGALNLSQVASTRVKQTAIKQRPPEDVLNEENAGQRAGESTELERKAKDADALDKGEGDRLTSDETRNLKTGQSKSTEIKPNGAKTNAERDEDGTGGIGPMNPQDDKQGERYHAAPGTLAATDTSVSNESIKKKKVPTATLR